MNLSKIAFVAAFTQSFDALRQSEDITKRELKALSRSLLSALHGLDDAMLTGDIQYVNQVLPVLSPVNKRVAVLYFKEFSGFHYDEKLAVFTKKSQKDYMRACDASIALIADVNQNIFTWAERHVEMEVKPFDEKKVTQFITNQIKKADKDGKGQLEVMRAVLAAGITPQVLLLLMDEMTKEPVKA